MIKVLIFDDNTDLLECMQLCLESYDFIAQTTSRKDDFYSELEGFTPDAVIIDVNLSGEDGRLHCKKLRKNKKYDHLPIILFSSDTNKLKDYEEYGADGTLNKPFDINEMSDLLTSTINKRKA
jgi:DNA-binding response OmpR family regulator